MDIPLVDLSAQHEEIADEVEEGFARVIERTAFILGEEVETFERAFADFSGVKHCVGVASGTDALELSLRALSIGSGDEVILPANSFIATALAVVRAGATPVLVDCDPTYYLIDTEQAASRLGPRSKAIIPVHLYGQMASIEDLEVVVAGSGAAIVEDAAQSHGARRNGRCAGSLGQAAGVSFYPGKNLGAYGDAGAVLTDSEHIAQRLLGLRNWGSEDKYRHPEIGFNSRLDTIQAVVLAAKLKRLAAWNEKRRAAAKRYEQLLSSLDEVVVPAILDGNEHVWHLYVVRVPRRDEVLEKLHSAGIGAGVHYPVPIHLQGAFRGLPHGRGDFPVAESAADEILSLPMYPHITGDQQSRVAEELGKALL